MVIIKKPTNNKGQKGCGEKESILPCWWERKLVQPQWKTVRQFLKKAKNRVAMQSRNPTPEKLLIQKDTCTPLFKAALLLIAKTLEQPKCWSTGG